MKNLTNLERAESFFIKVQQNRRWAFILLVPLVILICILDILGKGTFWYWLALIYIIFAGLYEAVWLLSYAAPLLFTHLRKSFFKKTMEQTSEQPKSAEIAPSRITPAQKTTAENRLKELKAASDQCFSKSEDSFLYVQWLDPETCPEIDGEEFIKPFGNKGWHFAIDEDKCHLFICKDVKNGRERVTARWLAPNAGYIDSRTAEKVEMIKDKPVLFSYGMIREFEDGTEMPEEKPICAITWIGGRQ